jgi:hypothetical protein
VGDHGSGRGLGQLEAAVWPGLVVVADVLAEHYLEMPL